MGIQARFGALTPGADVQGGEKGKEALKGLQWHRHCRKGVPRLPHSQVQPWKAAGSFHMEQGEPARPEGAAGRAWRRWGLHENTPAAEQTAATLFPWHPPFALGEKIHFSLKIPPSHLPSELLAGTVTWHQCDPLSPWRKSCSPPTQCTSSRGASWGSCACCPKLPVCAQNFSLWSASLGASCVLSFLSTLPVAMSFSHIQILRGIFSSSSLFSHMSKLPLNPAGQFTMLNPFSQGLVISRLSHWSFLPSRLLPSSPPVHLSRVTYLLCHPQILLLPRQCSSHQSLLFSHSAPCTTFFWLFPLPPLFPFILALLSSPRRQFVHRFLPISYQSFLYMPETWSGFSTRSDPYLLCLWLSLVLSHFATSK